MEDNKTPMTDVDVSQDVSTNNESLEVGTTDEQPTKEDLVTMMQTITSTLKSLETSVKVMEEQWLATAREFQITDTHMKELGKWNADHRTEKPEGLSEEEAANWDYLNGIDSITIEEITRIFGEDSPIHGMSEEITKDRVKEVCQTYFGWLMIMREYRESHDAYLELLEVQEEAQLEVLKANAEKEEDPEKKEKMESAIDSYYKFKYLGFLSDISDKEIQTLLKALKDEKKCTYWVNRTRDKLKQYKVSPKFIMEIAGFEKRFEKDYSSIMNILLLYFMNICIYSDAHDKKDPNNTKTMSMIIGLDDVIRNVWKDEKAKRVMDNVEAFLDKVMEYKKNHSEE